MKEEKIYSKPLYKFNITHVDEIYRYLSRSSHIFFSKHFCHVYALIGSHHCTIHVVVYVWVSSTIMVGSS